jgi:hypothetical protein
MPQLFPPSTNTWAKAFVLGGLLVLGATVGGAYVIVHSPYMTGVQSPLDQPVPFSHEHHVGGLGIECLYCHSEVERSASAGIPSTEICMTCHSQVWRDAPVLEPVRASWREQRPMRWNRVHDLPDYVYFNHSIHVTKGVGCVACHGDVARMPLMTKVADLSMRWCLQCHRSQQSQNGGMLVSATQTEGQMNLHTRLQDCSTCHR